MTETDLHDGEYLRSALPTPAAWHGAELADSDDWVITLTPRNRRSWPRREPPPNVERPAAGCPLQ